MYTSSPEPDCLRLSISTVRRVLPPILHHHLSNIPLTFDRLRSLRPSQQQYSHASWPTRCCFSRPWLSLRCLHSDRAASALPCRSHCLHPGRFRQWPGGRGVECHDWRHGERESSPWFAAWVLRPGRDCSAIDRDDNDHKGPPKLVLLVLSDDWYAGCGSCLCGCGVLEAEWDDV